MYDFSGTFGTGDWGVTIGTTPQLGGTIWTTGGYPTTYPYPTTYGYATNNTNQLLMLGLVIVAAVLLLKR